MLSLQDIQAMQGAGRVPYLPREKWQELNAEDRAECGLYKGLDDCEAKVSDSDGKSLVSMVLSTGQVDRDGDTLSPAGWDIKAFRKNGVILWAHDQRSPPIGVATKVQKNVDGKLLVDAEFTPEDLNPLGHQIFRMIKAKFLKAVSVGFLPKKHEQPDESEGRGWGVDFKIQEALEGSVVTVPSNTGAFATAKSAGINVYPMVEWCETHLDFVKGSGLWMTRERLEEIWGEAKDEKKTFDFGRIVGEPGTLPDDANSDNEDKTVKLSDADVDRIVDRIAAAVAKATPSLKDSAANDAAPSELSESDAAEGSDPEPVGIGKDFLAVIDGFGSAASRENEQ